MSAMEKQSQQQFDELVAAAKAGTIDDVILRSQGDFPYIAKIKLLIIDGAIVHSNPSGHLLSQDPQCLNIFHAVRVWLVDLAFYFIRLRDETKLKEKLEIMKMNVSTHFEPELYKTVEEAMEDVATRPHDVLQLEYRLAGKLDILEKAIELHRAQTIKNGKPPFQSDLNNQEADMIITANTLVKDTTKFIKDTTKVIKDTTKVIKDTTKVIKDTTKVIKDTTEVSTSGVVVAPAAEDEATVPATPVEATGISPVDDNSDMPDLDTVSNEAVDGDSDVSDDPVNFVANVTRPTTDTTVSPTATTVSPTAQPDRVVEATQDVPGSAGLGISDGTNVFGPLTQPLAPGLIATLSVSFDPEYPHLRNIDLYLGAFTEMVEAFNRRVNDIKADEDAAGDSDVAADSDASINTEFGGSDASYQLIRSPAGYTGDSDDSDESL
jgi:hypothetical protein